MLIIFPVLAFLVVFFVVWTVRGAGFGAALSMSGRNGVLARGLPARGLILSASSSASETSQSGQRFELRSMLLDVEIPGQAPYEISVTPMIPRICEACPGAALDLRVDPQNRRNVAIVGPAGSSAWLGAAPWLLQPPPVLRFATASRFVASMVVAAVASLFTFGLTHSATHDAEHHTTPAPATVATKPQCAAAARCCKVLGSPDCRSFASMSDTACGHALQEERKLASKTGKRCP